MKLTYSNVSNFNFVQAVQKIATTPTHGKTAAKIYKTTKALNDLKKQITKEYQTEIVETFGKKDAEGKLIRPPTDPQGFEPDEARTEGYIKAHEAFGTKEVELDIRPFNLGDLSDMKISAQDLESLGQLYLEGPVLAGHHD